MSRDNDADVTVIALVGERNREVRAFLENELGPEGRKRSVVVVATSDRPAPLRIRACFVALAVAEYFRDQGKNVLLVVDSVTGLAMAQREIGLAAGEPPSQKGYTPSVFAMLPKIFERAGHFKKGSITGFFTVLVEGDDFNEPVCDAVRAILDGHIVLSRDLGSAGHYPAIDVLQSVSRLAPRLYSPEQREAALKIRDAMATHHALDPLAAHGLPFGTQLGMDARRAVSSPMVSMDPLDIAQEFTIGKPGQLRRELVALARRRGDRHRKSGRQHADNRALEPADMIDIGNDAFARLAAHRADDRHAAGRHVEHLAGEFAPVRQHVAAEQIDAHALEAALFFV